MLSRKLIAITSLASAITLMAGCSLTKPNKDIPVQSSADPIAVSDSAPESETPVKQEPETVYTPMNNDELLEKVCGFYVNKSYFKDFEKTKSAADSQSHGESVFVYMDEETQKYSLMHGDMHQGNKACILTDVSFDKKENKYTLSFEPYAEGYETVLEYNDSTGTYLYKGYGTGTPVNEEFLRFDDYYRHKEYLAYLILKDSPDVTVEGQRIYADVNGIRKYIEISSDATFDSSEASKVSEQGALGYVSFREEGVTEFDFLYYTIENNTMHIIDDELNNIMSLRLS